MWSNLGLSCLFYLLKKIYTSTTCKPTVPQRLSQLLVEESSGLIRELKLKIGKYEGNLETDVLYADVSV